jgi:AraC-like DNA-binding protein
MAEHLHANRLYCGSTVSVRDVRCRPTGEGCGGEEVSAGHDIVFPRAGAFLKHLGRQQFLADSNHVLFFTAGEPYRVSHPVPGGDDCTVFSFVPEVLLDALSRYRPAVRDRPDLPFGISHAPNPPRSLLFQHRLRQWLRTPGGCGIAVEELALALLDAVIDAAYGARGHRPAPLRTTTGRAHRERAEATKRFLASRFRTPLSLAVVALAVHTSPYHLARLFRREVGLPIHAYLNRLRLGAALDRLADGVASLTDLALDLGYSSHSHFSEAFRRQFGTSPSDLRRALTVAGLREMSKNLKA